MSLHGSIYERRLIRRHQIGQAFEWLCRLATFAALGVLIVLLLSVLKTAFSPGRGHGPAPVSTTTTNRGTSVWEGPIQFKVSKVLGGQFEFKDHPGKRITAFSADEIVEGKVIFDHNGSRTVPAFDLVVVSKDGDEKKFEKVEPKHIPENLPIPLPAAAPVRKPWGWLTWSFLTRFNSDDPFEAGIAAGLWGSLWLIALTALIAVPMGVGAAVYLEEYSKPTRMTKLIQLNIANLAGVPSIVYGILGFTVFARMFGIFDREKTILVIVGIEIPLPFGPTVITGACTLALLSLPVIIISSQEALRSVPASLRHAAYALGATKWQTIWHQILPAALPGILTGVILSLSRAIGEAAPLAVIGVATQLSYTPGRISGVSDVLQHPAKVAHAPFDRFTALPIQVYSWINETAVNFEHVAAAGILVLLGALLLMNGTAIFIRQRFQQKIRW